MLAITSNLYDRNKFNIILIFNLISDNMILKYKGGIQEMKGLLKFILIIVIIAIVVFIGGKFTSNNSSVSEKNVYIENIENPVSVKDIKTTKSENEARFDENYKEKQVKFTGTIKEIRTDILMSGSSVRVDEINFKEGWSLQFPTGYCKKLSQLNKGDTVEVVSRIKDVSSSTITVYDYGYRFENGRQVPINGTSIKLNGEEICIVNK